ncbi:molybdopterin-containing oxidoreductase family protein [Desulfolithobacter sp.]
MKKSVYSLCGMCAVRCPLRAEVEGDEVTWLEGNPHILGGALCAKGSAGVARYRDDERPHGPLIREGERGEGKWRQVSWDEAITYVTDKLKAIQKKYGKESVMVTSRGGPFQNQYKTFCHAIGSPNYTNHDCTCGRNTHHASKSLYGVGRTGLAYDYKNAKHLILFGRNILTSLKVGEASAVVEMLRRGGKITAVDVRVTPTSGKANRFFLVRPGTDYALALGMVNEILKQKAYDQKFIKKYVKDFSKLQSFVKPYTAAWAAKECGVDAAAIKAFVTDIKQDMPRVIFHPGWNLARYKDSFYVARMLHIMNILMGNIEVEGGQFFPKGPADCGKKGLRNVDCPKPDIERADGCGSTYPHLDKGPGLEHLLLPPMKTGKPYPIKALISNRHDLIAALPDKDQLLDYLNHCELLVSMDALWGEFTWYCDVVLPESTFLERSNQLVTQKGLKPRFAIRQQAVSPRYDTKPSWEIYKMLADKMGVGEYFPYETIEDYWNWQLEPTGYSIEDFQEKGFIELTDKPVWYDRDKLDGKFKTPSGKIEIISKMLEDAGIESLKPYEPPQAPEKGTYRLVYGRPAWLAHNQSTNNPILSQLTPDNRNNIWINKDVAEGLGIKNGDWVEVKSAGEYGGPLQAFVTEYIHPEAVYTDHGFGKEVPVQSRAYNKGVSDAKLMTGLLDVWDRAGGAVALCESFVTLGPCEPPADE